MQKKNDVCIDGECYYNFCNIIAIDIEDLQKTYA